MTETIANPAPRTRTLPPRDARSRFVARLGAAPMAPRVASPRTRTSHPRVRSLPSRDARGRFVSFPTTSAPSWYVLCADGYRIPGEVEVMSVAVIPPPAPLPPARVVRPRRPGMRRDEIVNWFVMLAFLVGMYWYAFSLPVPHRWLRGSRRAAPSERATPAGRIPSPRRGQQRMAVDLIHRGEPHRVAARPSQEIANAEAQELSARQPPQRR